MDITTIQGKALLDRKIFIQLLGHLEPVEHTKDTTLYDVGYEKAKADCLKIIGRSLGPEFTKSAAVRLIQELRRDKGA